METKYEQYLAQAETIDDLGIDIGFIISKEYYFGPSNYGASGRPGPEFFAPLTLPKIELYGQFALSAAIGDPLVDLGPYYTSVLQTAKQHNKPTHKGDAYFWLRPIVFRRGYNSFVNPYHDTMRDALQFLQPIADGKRGWVYDDQDQGFHIMTFVDDAFVTFLSMDDDDNLHWAVRCPRDYAQQTATATIERAKSQINALTALLGKDYWT